MGPDFPVGSSEPPVGRRSESSPSRRGVGVKVLVGGLMVDSEAFEGDNVTSVEVATLGGDDTTISGATAGAAATTAAGTAAALEGDGN